MTSSKTCFKCGEIKPLDEFYKHPQMADGYLNKCKTCSRIDASTYRAANLEEVRAYDRARSKNPERVRKQTEVTRLWRQEDKRRARAHSAVARAVRNGELLPQPCLLCGSDKVVAHHEDYDKPLEVVWLCQPCHKQHHLSKL